MPAECLEGGGEMGARMRALDWSRTPLGPVSSWPQSLRTIVSTCLGSRYPIVIAWGPEFVTLYNDAYAPLAGTKHPAAIGRPISEVWPEVWNIVGPMLAGVMERGEATWSDQMQLSLLRHGFREECYFTFSYSPIWDEAGRIGGVFTVVTEMTEHVLSQRRIEVLRRIAQSAAGSTSVAEACRRSAEALASDPADVPFALIYACRPGGGLALVAHHGVQPGTELSPLTCHMDSAPWRMGELLRAPGTMLVFDVGDRGLPGGPWPEPSRVAVAQSFAAAGVPLGVLVTGTSPRLAFDARYRGFHEVVGGHVGSAVGSARAYEQEHARAAALGEFDRAKTAFFSNVSHEFRTPLSLILAPVQEAAESSDHALRGAELDAVLRNANRLRKLVDQLLDFARIEARRATVRRQPTDLAALTMDVASAFRSTIERSGLELRVDCQAPTEPALVDPEIWEKIVLNLLSNAFKFTFEGAIDVVLREREAELELRVRDTGVGIASDQLPRVFERFHRVEGAPSRSHEGSGIGLALVRDLVHLHGGAITVTSSVGIGTEFVVTIPRARASVAGEPVTSGGYYTQAFVDEATQWLPDASGEAPAAPVSDTRILLADDNADMRAYIARLLGKRWSVTAVCDGVQAVESARRERPDLVLCDVMVPNLDGLGVVRELRADPQLKTLPIILLSARAGDEAIADGLRSGADDYIVKPFSANQLVARVEAQLSAARVREAAHEERRRLFAALMDAPIVFVVLTGDDLVIEMSNNAALKTWYRTRDVIGKPMLEAFPELHGQPFAELMREVLRTGIPHRNKAVLVRGPADSGLERLEDRYYDYSYEPIKGENALLMIAVDVSEQVRARQAVEAALDEARRANQAKDEFLALLGHELRNPMSPIATALEMMKLRGDRDVTREREVIDRQARRLMHLVDDLLDVSRIAHGRVELSRRRVGVGELVALGLEATLPLIEQRRHRVDVDVPDDLAVYVDPDRMGQVLSNLLTNAAKYTPPGGRIKVTARREGADIAIAVRDTGIGIAPDMLPHVFEMFTQERQALDRSQGGLGIGLAIVRGLVQQHGGTVTARSEGRGLGSELEVRLPAHAGEAATDEAAALQPGMNGRARSSRRILIVDDNADAASMLAEVVSSLGHETRVAYEGATALEIAEAFAPEIALVDIGLPGMDGYELGRRLHERDRTTQVIAVTGYGRKADRERSASAGFTAHLVKPVDMAKLAEVIDELPQST